jgi:hypothetical protein
VDFEAYLISKKIDSAEFLKAEPDLWKNWKIEFDQMHPVSFTAQKLYLINPIRRKYLLKTQEPAAKVISTAVETPTVQQNDPTSADQQAAKTSASPKPIVPRPVFKPKPKTS